MDRGGGATLRKRALSIDSAGMERDSKASWEAEGVAVEEEPVSPTRLLFRDPHFSCHIVSVFGLGAPVDLPAMRSGVAATLARHPRFCSVQGFRSATRWEKVQVQEWAPCSSPRSGRRTRIG